MKEATFPPNFLWGAATSAYQIEGGSSADGRGESIWDRFSSTPGRVVDNSTGDVACDHYRLFESDVSLMKNLGLRGYRFSISWPRVIPSGRGSVNHRGLDFYDTLVDSLLGASIEPFATLYHWDLPQQLQERGGWPARATADAFAYYARIVSERLGDRVKNWITINEPWCVSMLSHQLGRHAPGLAEWPAALLASHHVMLAHGWATKELRAAIPDAKVGIALNLVPAQPASMSLADREACRQFDGYFNRWFLDPIYGRGYPADIVNDYRSDGRLPTAWESVVQDTDMTTIATPLDFLGVNYYHRKIVRSEVVPETENAERLVFPAPESDWTEMGWEVYPLGLYDLLRRVHEEYAPPEIYITENGASYSDIQEADGRVRDERRVRFLRDHLLAAHTAIERGVPLSGYFVWSLLDNFEWERGYTQRFGIVWVDFATQSRKLKDSALWYCDVIRRNGVALEDETLV